MANHPAQSPREVCGETLTAADLTTLEEARAFFARDRFATDRCGCIVEVAEVGRAVCAMEVTDAHRNAMGAVMGGALFTLADFALAVASNFGQAPAVSVSNTMEFVGAAKGSRLTATCTANKSGRRLGFYTVRIEDELGTLVALMNATCMRA